MSLLTKFLGAYCKTGWRGSYRLTIFLSHRLKSLQCVPVKTESGTLHADLRISSSHGILANPKSHSGEDFAMRNFVKKGDIVFDIGAHFGFYTLLLSELVGGTGKVYAFEPNPELLPSLKRTIESLTNIELFSTALSDREGEINLFVPEDASMASLADWTNGNAGRVHQVACKMRRLDDLMQERNLSVPNFIKCDVEGAELSVFNGALKTLNRPDAPILMFEVNAKAADAFGKTPKSYFEFLNSLEHPKYNFFEVTINGVEELKSTEMEYTNIVAVPESKRSLYQNI